jgi:pimeloyl-ACP methyl ester carboxylesterase
LLADQGMEVGRLDTRITAPKARDVPQDRPSGANDPALGLGRSNVIKSTLYRDYFVKELRVPTSRDYVSLTLDVNFKWNWRSSDTRPSFYVNPTSNIATLMEKRPQARVLLLSGYFDLTTPVLASRYSLTHAGLPLERVEMHAFAAGHSPFEGNENRAAVAAVVRAFLQEH